MSKNRRKPKLKKRAVSSVQRSPIETFLHSWEFRLLLIFRTLISLAFVAAGLFLLNWGATMILAHTGSTPESFIGSGKGFKFSAVGTGTVIIFGSQLTFWFGFLSRPTVKLVPVSALGRHGNVSCTNGMESHSKRRRASVLSWLTRLWNCTDTSITIPTGVSNSASAPGKNSISRPPIHRNQFDSTSIPTTVLSRIVRTAKIFGGRLPQALPSM
jgi:hypothetical protein